MNSVKALNQMPHVRSTKSRFNRWFIQMKPCSSRPRTFGRSDETGCGRSIIPFPIHNADPERRWCRLQRANFQSWTSETIERLCNYRDASTRFDRRDEAGDAVVFLDNLRRAVQWRKQ